MIDVVKYITENIKDLSKLTYEEIVNEKIPETSILEPKDYKQIIIDTFKILIKNEETQKELNWQFKRKAYKQVIDILSVSTCDNPL